MGHFLALKVIHLLLSTAVDKIIFKFVFMSYQKSHNCVCFWLGTCDSICVDIN